MVRQLSWSFVLAVVAGAVSAPVGAAQRPRWPGEFADAPARFIPPPLDPTGATLHPVKLGSGVWVLRGDRGAVNNIGVVVGTTGVLVVDSHVSPGMARQALALIATITPLPIRYLVNTNRHGDHLFGNATFPASTIVVGQSSQLMGDRAVNAERSLLAAFTGKPELFESLQYRPPDLWFADSLDIDLGGQPVRLLHVGPANTLGDVVVWAPGAGVVFTGNLFTEAGVPLLWEADALAMIRVADRVAELKPRSIVAGHLEPSGPEMIDFVRRYAVWLDQAVNRALAAGWSPARIGDELDLPAEFLRAGSPPFHAIVRGFHSLNALRSAQLRQPASSPPAEPSDGWVPLRFAGGRPIVQVAVNGQSPRDFILDTGAGTSLIDASAAKSLALSGGERIRVRSPFGDEGIEAERFTVPRLEAAGAALTEVPIVVMDLTRIIARLDPGIAGVLSAAAMGGFRVTVDYARERWRVERGALPEPDQLTVFGYSQGRRLPGVPVRIGTRVFDVDLDSGSGASLSFPRHWADSLPLAGRPVAADSARTIDRAVATTAATLGVPLSIGSSVVAAVAVRFIDVPAGPVTVGQGVLRQFRVTIDPANRRVRLEPVTREP